jgi:hypothetical protein
LQPLHEYIADEKAVKEQNKAEYYNKLLAHVFETQQFSFVNPFFKQSLIKKRILMLSRTKSKQIHSFKYALLIPLVFIMLMYTSAYAQEKTETIVETIQTEDSNLSDKELRKKYYNKILKMTDNGASFMEIHEFTMPDLDKYISSKTNYYKFAAYMQYIFDASDKRKEENQDDFNKEIGISESIKSNINRTYEEYLAWKQTDEAKEIWENNIGNGVLRLLVDDAGNMTEAEIEKMNHKLDMIERDSNFNKLIISSLDGRSKIILENPKSPTAIVEEVELENIENSIEVPFAVIEQVPVMLGCQNLTSNDERKACMSKNITKHVNDNFNTDIAKKIGLTGRQRISVIFKIDTQGEVIDVRARAAHPELEIEAKRVIKLLPQFKPGVQKGQVVTVPYSLPILFQVDSDKKKGKKN